MTIRCRPMRRRDVSACVRILAAHPVAGPRYGEDISQLRSVWLFRRPLSRGTKPIKAQEFE